MRRLLSYLKSHLCLTAVVLFVLIAAVPWAISAVRVAQAGDEVTFTALQEDREKENRKDEQEKHKGSKELKALWRDAEQTWWLGTKGGLYSGKNGAFAKVDGGPKLEVRAITGTADALWTGGKDGVWQRLGGAWKQVREGDCFGLSVMADGSLAAAFKKDGALVSTDAGKTWAPLPGTAEFKEEPHHD
jgi:ligand-binding sensor domain-containing protein